jgi:hypothetical protein
MNFEELYQRFQDPDQRSLLSKEEIEFVFAGCRKKICDEACRARDSIFLSRRKMCAPVTGK